VEKERANEEQSAKAVWQRRGKVIAVAKLRVRPNRRFIHDANRHLPNYRPVEVCPTSHKRRHIKFSRPTPNLRRRLEPSEHEPGQRRRENPSAMDSGLRFRLEPHSYEPSQRYRLDLHR
jgi:hypothetical protein